MSITITYPCCPETTINNLTGINGEGPFTDAFQNGWKLELLDAHLLKKEVAEDINKMYFQNIMKLNSGKKIVRHPDFKLAQMHEGPIII